MHKHKMKTEVTRAWAYCVNPHSGCSGAAHGAVTRVQTCSCGATRRIEGNGRHATKGQWYDAEPDGSIETNPRRV